MWIELLKEFFGKMAGERVFLAPAEANALVASGSAKAVQEDPLAPVIAKGVAAALEGFNKGLDGIIQQTLQKFAQAQTLSQKNGAAIIFGQGGQGDRNKTFGDWLLAVARGDRGYLEKHYGSKFNEWQQKAALAEASGAAGGFTVPTEFYQALMTVAAEKTFIRPRAFVMPMGSATMQFPYLDITTVQAAGIPAVIGGVQMSWTAEAQTRTETEPNFKQMELKANELSGYSVSSNILLQDSVIGLEKYLMYIFGTAIGWFEEYAFLQGTGVGKPQGMLGCTAAIPVTRQTASSVTFQDIAKMWGQLLPASWGNAIWTFSPSVVQQLLQLKDGANRAVFISIDQGITKTPYWSLLGRPAFPTEKVPALGTKGDLMLLDPAFYVIGDRQQIEIASSEHVNFLKNQMTWRVVARLDGQPWMDKPITLQDATTQVSPFVVLN